MIEIRLLDNNISILYYMFCILCSGGVDMVLILFSLPLLLLSFSLSTPSVCRMSGITVVMAVQGPGPALVQGLVQVLGPAAEGGTTSSEGQPRYR